jgi:hypothetical protein
MSLVASTGLIPMHASTYEICGRSMLNGLIPAVIVQLQSDSSVNAARGTSSDLVENRTEEKTRRSNLKSHNVSWQADFACLTGTCHVPAVAVVLAGSVAAI